MNAAQLRRLVGRLRPFNSRERLETLPQPAISREMRYIDFLDSMLTEEAGTRTVNNSAMRERLARFPFVKAVIAFDFAYSDSLEEKPSAQLVRRFIEQGENLVILGNRGVGKSRLAARLGLKAVEHGHSVLFTTAETLIATLTDALKQGTLEEALRLYIMPGLLIVDEFGYLPIQRDAARLFFQVVSGRYERGPMILVSNQGLYAWGEVIGDIVTATATLELVLHHCITINVRGGPHRIADKLKPRLVWARKPESMN